MPTSNLPPSAPFALHVNIGLEEHERGMMSHHLSCLLADTYGLYLMTHGFHWNVKGPMFTSLHDLFMQQYTALWNSIDIIAERIVILGFAAPASYGAFSTLTSLDPLPDAPPNAQQMVYLLFQAHQKCAQKAHQVLRYAESIGDTPTADLMTVRAQEHQKMAWMLRSILQS